MKLYQKHPDCEESNEDALLYISYADIIEQVIFEYVTLETIIRSTQISFGARTPAYCKWIWKHGDQ